MILLKPAKGKAKQNFHKVLEPFLAKVSSCCAILYVLPDIKLNMYVRVKSVGYFPVLVFPP